jgi:hypothetical protein
MNVFTSLSLLLLLAVVNAHVCDHRQRFDIHVAHHEFATPIEMAKRELSQGACDESASDCAVAPIRIVFDTRYLATGTERNGAISDVEACGKVGQPVEVESITDDSATMRIACTSDMIMTPEVRTTVLAALQNAKRRIEQIFSVIPISRVVFPDNLQGWCAGDAIDMSMYTAKSPSVPDTATADLLIVVTARPTADAVLAWAQACIVTQYGRPAIGHINVGINQMRDADPLHLETVVLHEMLHVLGFSGAIADGRFVDPATGTLLGETLITATTSGGERTDATFLATPQVTRQVREHFDCNALAGGEMEESASHWEARIFPNEIMSPTISPLGAQPTLSALTLAFFQDTGYYVVDYSKVGEISFGHELGCNVPTEFCKKWPAPYNTCLQMTQDCSSDRRGYGACTLLKYDAGGKCPLTQPWQEVFTDDGCVGGEEFTDFCAFPPAALLCSDSKAVEAVNKQDVSGKTAYSGMSGGAASRCFQSSVVSSGFRPTSSQFGVGCFVTQCTDGELSVKVGGKSFDCPSRGGTINIVVDKSTGDFGTGYNGSLVCPPAAEVCCDCGGRGFCAEGKCVCNAGFGGSKCGAAILAPAKQTLPNPAKWPENPFTSPILGQTRRVRNGGETATVNACVGIVAMIAASMLIAY